MEQYNEMLPPLQPLGMVYVDESAASKASEQNRKIEPPQQIPEIESSPKSTLRRKATTNRADWVKALWADISGQLRRLSVISNDLFDGLVLKKDTATGLLILSELRKEYQLLGDDRTLATVKVVAPEGPMSEVWQLLWTIKRHRDPNGRRFHSAAIIDPIDHRRHLELDSSLGEKHSVTDFSLPLFIQDYGPGPSDFDPEPGNQFDTLIRDRISNADVEI